MIRKIMWAILALAALGDCSCSTENPNEKDFPRSAPTNVPVIAHGGFEQPKPLQPAYEHGFHR